ncbi:MAG: phosphopentomutase [Paracoccaceae bacterium]
MARAFLVVMDSLGIGGAPDAGAYFNGDIPDRGANTLLHIAEACAAGRAEEGRSGPLYLPNLTKLGIGAALKLASSKSGAGLPDTAHTGWGVASEVSKGKDTPSGHWELAGVPVPWEWHYFPDKTDSFPQEVIKTVCEAAEVPRILGNCHASGTEIIDRLGAEHCQSGAPICYTSADSVFQIAAHETHFGLERLIKLCSDIAPKLHEMRVGRVIARPFVGTPQSGFSRTEHRRDFAMPPPKPVLSEWVQSAGHPVIALGKIGDIFSMRGIDEIHKGNDHKLMGDLLSQTQNAPDGAFVFANFVEFDSHYGHRRDIAGYARALEWFDAALSPVLAALRPDDMMILTADHGNDPSWHGTDHTRERVPVLCAGKPMGHIGHIGFADVARLIANHLGVPVPPQEPSANGY